MQNIKKSKFVWTVLLGIALCFFLISLKTNNYLFNVVTILLAFVVYRYGYDAMFKEYDEERKIRRETLLKEREEALKKKQKGES